MWECINGEYIWIDKEMGWKENERQRIVEDVASYTYRDVRDAGSRLTTGDVAVGVASGMIVAKAVPRVGGWLLWMAMFAVIAMIML